VVKLSTGSYAQKNWTVRSNTRLLATLNADDWATRRALGLIRRVLKDLRHLFPRRSVSAQVDEQRERMRWQKIAVKWSGSGYSISYEKLASPQIRSHDFWHYINLYVILCCMGLFKQVIVSWISHKQTVRIYAAGFYRPGSQTTAPKHRNFSQICHNLSKVTENKWQRAQKATCQPTMTYTSVSQQPASCGAFSAE